MTNLTKTNNNHFNVRGFKCFLGGVSHSVICRSIRSRCSQVLQVNNCDKFQQFNYKKQNSFLGGVSHSVICRSIRSRCSQVLQVNNCDKFQQFNYKKQNSLKKKDFSKEKEKNKKYFHCFHIATCCLS